MANYDMQGQKVQTQQNADIIINESAKAIEAQSDAQKELIASSCINSTFKCSYGTLYGRSQELDELKQLLYRDKPIVAVQAIGGMGKTALARECCIAREVWKSYDVILGAQAVKRQILVDTRAAKSGVVSFDQLGTVLRSREVLVTIAGQLNVRDPVNRTETDLENDIVQSLDGRSALVILDNLETMENTREVLALLERICSPPTRKALITTRQLPEDHSASFAVLPLNAIRELAACRLLVIERLGSGIGRGSDADDAIEAIVEVAQGHPLALELLTGKLLTQGKGSIRELGKKWKSNSADTLNDEFLSALCNYVFDDRFLEHIGPVGTELLSVMAFEDAGVQEEAARQVIDLSSDHFDAMLSKLFKAGCIHRELRDDISVLAMHPITQAYFRARSECPA